jgi:hypothetical protein
MTSDLDVRLSASLREHAVAGSPVDPAPLLAGAVAKGRRLRRRRRVAAAGAAVLVLLGVAAVVVLPERHHATPAEPGPAGLTLPAVKGVPGAAQRPDLVGTDPSVLHLSVDALLEGATSMRLDVSTAPATSEVVSLSRGSNLLALTINRLRDDATLDRAHTPVGTNLSAPFAGSVGGLPATVVAQVEVSKLRPHSWAVRWQPAYGLWAHAKVWAPTWAEAESMLKQVRFDRATRCAVPFKLTYLPPGAAVRSCTVQLSTTGKTLVGNALLTVGDSSHQMVVSLVSGAMGPTKKPDLVQAGPYRAVEHVNNSWAMNIGEFRMISYIIGLANESDKSEAIKTVGGFRMSGDPENPATW